MSSEPRPFSAGCLHGLRLYTQRGKAGVLPVLQQVFPEDAPKEWVGWGGVGRGGPHMVGLVAGVLAGWLVSGRLACWLAGGLRGVCGRVSA